MTDPGLSAGDAARRLGIAVTTLRTWHQRYGLGPVDYHPGQHRRYREPDMVRLEAMLRLTADGVPAAQAARIVLATGPVPTAPARAGGGHTIPIGRGGAAARGLARAAMRLDSTTMVEVILAAIAHQGVVRTWDQLIRPVLGGLGQRQQDSAHLIDVEHLLSRSVSEALAAVPRPANGDPSRTLLACADEEQHTLPLEALAAALAEAGAACRQLGARVPPQALLGAVTRTGPAVVTVWSQTVGTGDPEQLRTLLDARPRPVVVAAAGPGWRTDALPPAIARPADLAEAVELTLAAI